MDWDTLIPGQGAHYYRYFVPSYVPEITDADQGVRMMIADS